MRTAATLLLCFFLPVSTWAAEPIDYLRDIRPIFHQRCVSCHGVLRQKARLRLDTAAHLRHGGRSGPGVEPGNSGDSILMQAVTGEGRKRMPPPEEGAPLSTAQVALLRAWIDQGAGAPAEPEPEGPGQHWAFHQPVRPPLPKTMRPGHNPIDTFIAAEQERRDLRSRQPASKEALLRRVYLDLIGLPPTRAELHAFLADESEAAYEHVVDRLLASPHYGERWARHWMDVWRYSDWYGRRAVPDWWNSAPQVWRWRDWIVRSLQSDKGYDRMVQEMLAGDEVAPGDDEAAVATGYLVRNWYALNPHQWLRDVVEHTGKAFLGLTLNCAHCHDHKYDPISHEEYFRFRAFFEPIDLRQDRVPGEADPGPFAKYSYSVLHKVVKTGSIRVFDERPEAKTFVYSGGDERNRIEGRPPVTPAAPAFLGGDRLAMQPIELPPTAYYPGLKPFVRQEEVAKCDMAVSAARSTLTTAQHHRENLPAPVPGHPHEPRLDDAQRQAEAAARLAEARLATAEAERYALAARIAADDAIYVTKTSNAGQLSTNASKAERNARLRAAEEKLLQAQLASGPKAAELRTAAQKVVEGARKVLTEESSKYTPLSPIYPKTSTGRRLALARWITSASNPLTARVAVNHVWMRHFGRPLVESVHDFGRNGKQPSHPELLDWLAVEFVESGWSMKHLHRLVVTSAVYRSQSGSASDDGSNTALDPDNRYLWTFPRQRVQAEVVRDSMLHAAGELDLTLGGPPLDNQAEAASRRRSLYFSVYPEDGGHPRFLELFDAPDPCDCYRRSESLVPQQALVLTNSQLALNMSRMLARNLSTEQGEDAAFVTAAFEQVLTRRPTSEELAVSLAFLRSQTQVIRQAPPAPAAPQVMPPSADAALRAREGLVRALFSHNDFITVR